MSQLVGVLYFTEAFARGFAGPVVHIVFASIWAYYIGRAKLCGRKILPVILATLAFIALLHGIYDFIVIALPMPAMLCAALLIAGIRSILQSINKKRPASR